jgi:hypothetical protein
LLPTARSYDGSEKPTTIVGFREHIFTGGLSSIANYMALQVFAQNQTALRFAAVDWPAPCCRTTGPRLLPIWRVL